MPVRHLYLARHAEPVDDGSRLTDRGVEQAALLGRRLCAATLDSVQHGPLPRAAETARVVAEQLAGPQIRVQQLDAAGDYVPSVPGRDEVAPEHADHVFGFLGEVSASEAAHGATLAERAVRLLTGPERGDADSHHLVVTHAFTIGWLVRHALDAPSWRWLGLNHGHAALTVLRFFTNRPPALVVFNDMSHLPDGLRWTGFPDDLRV